MTASRQTISFLTQRLKQVGIRPATRHGQNFLVDLNLLDLLVATADLRRHDVVLEVGTGTGGLTGLLGPQVAVVVTVEIDAALQQLAREELVDVGNVIYVQQDALHNKNRLATPLLDAVRGQLAGHPERSFKLVANLPYNIATPVLSNLLRSGLEPVSMTATIQKELADRITARPSTKDYGALSVWMQCQCRCEVVRILPPTAFWPRPKVHSAIIHIVPDDGLRSRIPDLDYFFHFVRGLFLHRRKLLREALVHGAGRELAKAAVDDILVQLGLRPDARAEQLSVEQMLALCEVFRAREVAVEKSAGGIASAVDESAMITSERPDRDAAGEP